MGEFPTCLTLSRNVLAKNYTGIPTVTQPFSFQKEKKSNPAKSDVILDVEIIVPPNKVTSIKIRRGDCVAREITIFAKLWGLN